VEFWGVEPKLIDMAIRKEFTLEELYLNGFSEREVAIMDYNFLKERMT